MDEQREALIDLVREHIMSTDYPVSEWEKSFADAILALQSTHASAGMGERDFQVRLYTLLSTLKAGDFSNSDIGAAYADEARELVAELEIRALNPDAPSGESGEGGGSL